MRLKFREKIYIVTLALFLLFFNSGIFALAFYSYKTNMDSAEDIATQEYSVIAEAFYKDCEFLNHSSQHLRLMQTYGSFYSERGVYLSFTEGKKDCFNNLPQGIFVPNGEKASTQKANGARYLVIARPINDGMYVLTYAKDVSYLDKDFFNICIVFVSASVGASAVLAVCLYLALRKLSKPLEKLRTATENIADGNFNARAEEDGNDEFSLLATDFNRMAEHIEQQLKSLEQENKTKQRMLDNLAHEMRTPLTSIRGYAEYLLNANIEEEEKAESLEFIISESERLKTISERLLDEAFIRENKIYITQNDMGEMIFGAVKKLSVSAAQAGVKLCADAKANVMLSCDKALTELLICNLAQNAIKACRGGGVVVIGCEIINQSVAVSVTDNGLGMTSEQLLHITEPFYRTDKYRSRNEGGTGLGLSLCKRIADAHGAKLEFYSELGKGTKAVVTFTKP